MNNDWFDEVRHNRLVEGTVTASIKVNCSPRTLLNVRPIITTKGAIEEWQLMISDPPDIDWKAASNDLKPTPGSPIITQSVIRFHPDDITTSINVDEQLGELRAKYERHRFTEGEESCLC